MAEIFREFGRRGENRSLIFVIEIDAWRGMETRVLKGVEDGGDHRNG